MLVHLGCAGTEKLLWVEKGLVSGQMYVSIWLVSMMLRASSFFKQICLGESLLEQDKIV